MRLWTVCSLCLLLLACGDDDGGADAATCDAATADAATRDAATADAAMTDAAAADAAMTDAATTDAAMTDAATTDAAMTDAAMTDAAAADAGSGASCTFNRDCPDTERCECDEATGCFCAVGPRGTGRNGLDTCVSGNDCASALCVEGPVDGTFYCSDECETADDCTGMLPRCIDVAFVGRICVRTPPDA